ncbi:MAG: hypothetical protein GX148_08755 [Clostridiales bacterium]|jgi:hypothetical protein|nr:hypothetical protein [Clostridiales bacterium]
MAVKVNTVRITASNTGYALVSATGTSAVAGTAEQFEFTFPAKDETVCILVTNGNVATVTARLSGVPGKGPTPPVLSLPVGTLGAFRIESGYVKNSDGKIILTVTPNASNTVSSCGVQVYGIYSGVITR